MEQLIGYAEMFWPFIVLAAIFYFLMYRPQKKQEADRKAFMSSLRVGDDVITVGGIHGIVKLIRESYVLLEIAEGVIVKFEKNAVSKRVGAEVAESPAEADDDDDDEEVEYVEEIVEVEEDEDEDEKKSEKEK
jgi:preprotein translocase subunit YajC